MVGPIFPSVPYVAGRPPLTQGVIPAGRAAGESEMGEDPYVTEATLSLPLRNLTPSGGELLRRKVPETTPQTRQCSTSRPPRRSLLNRSRIQEPVLTSGHQTRGAHHVDS